MSFEIPKCNCPWSTPAGPALASNCGGSAIWIFMTILETYLRAQCDLDDPCGRVTPRIRSKPDTHYDFIVVGGGTAGSVVAARLSEDPKTKVLLIEAGEDEPVGNQVPSMLTFWGSDVDWKYKTEPEKGACLNSGGICEWPRGKLLGGTGALNGMMYVRGNREDYDKWAALGNPGWNYLDVLPFFLKSENNLQIDEMEKQFHSTSGPLPISQLPYNPPMSYAILKGGEELGYEVRDLNGHNATGFAIAQTTSKNGVRFSTAKAFLRPANNRKNLHILLNTMVTKVIVRLKRAFGVEIIDSKTGKTNKVFAKKEVIVSGGAVNSPQILLLSGVGPEEDLRKVGIEPTHDLPGVGKHLMNHVSYNIKYFLNEPDVNPLNWETLTNYLMYRNGLMSGTGIYDVTAKFSSPYAEPAGLPDSQFYFSGFLASCSKDGAIGGLLSEGLRRITIGPTVLQAKSRGYITLASSNPLQHPHIVPNYLTDEHDVKVLLNGIRFANKLSETAPLKELGIQLDRTPVRGCEDFEFDTDAYWECAIRRDTAPENHQAGSCKMGPKHDKMAVVDHELRVHGIKGLRVIDASIMPELTSGNTMAPIIMIAEKGAHMIKEAWKPRSSNALAHNFELKIDFN